MADTKKSVLIVGGGAVGAIAAVNLEVGGLATVTVVLRSNYSVVKEKGYTIESCDHGRLDEWRPSVGMLQTLSAIHLPIRNYKKLTHPSPQHHPQPYRRRPPTIRLRRPLHQKHRRRLPHRRRPDHASPAQKQQQNHSNPPAKWPQHRKAILAPASQHPHSLRYLHDRQRGTLTGPHRPRRRRQASHRRVSHFQH